MISTASPRDHERERAGERNSAPEFGQPNPAQRPSIGRREDDKICPFGDVHMVASDRDTGNRAADRSNQFRLLTLNDARRGPI